LAIVNTTTTVATTVHTQLGSQIVVSSQSNTVTVGDFVTGVELQPYIANRIISFYAYNMRPNQRVHIFFDSVLVDDECAPGTRYPGNNYITDIISTADYNVIEKDGDWGTPIYADLFGQVCGQFNIPGGKFRTGERTLEIADVTSLALGGDSITTKASATFTASNLTVTKNTLTMTTINPEVSWVPIVNTFTTSATTVENIVIAPDFSAVYGTFHEPIAQALTINTPNKEAGIFATSLELYFQQKSQSYQVINGVNTYPYGVTVYLCETNNGYPDGSKILPFSTTHLDYSSINVSNTSGNVATKFTFESPVFLQNGLTYAFIVKPDNNDPDYRVYSANLGNIDIDTNQQVFQQPAVGTAFYGATTTQWTALQTEYIKFKLNRAAFTNAYGNAVFNNANTDYLTVYNVGYSNSSVGILSGDYVFESINSTASTANTSKKGTLNFYDDVKGIVYVANSTGNFTPNTFIQIHRFANATLSSAPNTTTLIAYANTGNLQNIQLNAFVPQFASITPAGTGLVFNYKGTSNTYGADSLEYPVNSGTETEFYDQERIIASRTNENTNMSSAKSLTIRAYMTTDSEFVSPVIDTVRYQQLAVSNKVDAVSFDYQEFFNDGNAKSKYVSQVITLADGQDAQDLNVTVTAYRPPQADIQIWVKFMNGEDIDPMNAKIWAPLINKNADIYCDPSNPNDYREFTFTVPEYYGMIPSNGTITCTNTSANITGTSTAFTTELKTGWYINMLANSTFNETTRQIVNIANNTALTLDQPFVGNYTANAFFIVPPPSTPYLSTNTSFQLSGQVSTSTTTNIVTGFSNTITANTTVVNNAGDAILITGANTYYTAGDRVFYYVPAGNTAVGGLTGNNWYYIQASNTTAVKLAATSGGAAIDLTGATTTPGEVHSLNKTNFTLEIAAGSTISINGDSQRVVSVTNAVSLTVEKPWINASSLANAYNISPSGVTYLNKSYNLYSKFKQFQIKIILQSDDSSKIPMINDIRALALQL
jgi:hypothetical protein